MTVHLSVLLVGRFPSILASRWSAFAFSELADPVGIEEGAAPDRHARGRRPKDTRGEGERARVSEEEGREEEARGGRDALELEDRRGTRVRSVSLLLSDDELYPIPRTAFGSAKRSGDKEEGRGGREGGLRKLPQAPAGTVR